MKLEQAVNIVKTVFTYGTSTLLHVTCQLMLPIFLLLIVSLWQCLTITYSFGQTMLWPRWFFSFLTKSSSPLGKIKFAVSPDLSLNFPFPPRDFFPFSCYSICFTYSQCRWLNIDNTLFSSLFFFYPPVQCKTYASVFLKSWVCINLLHLKFSLKPQHIFATQYLQGSLESHGQRSHQTGLISFICYI